MPKWKFFNFFVDILAIIYYHIGMSKKFNSNFGNKTKKVNLDDLRAELARQRVKRKRIAEMTHFSPALVTMTLNGDRKNAKIVRCAMKLVGW
jgi:hypothetical protein